MESKIQDYIPKTAQVGQQITILGQKGGYITYKITAIKPDGLYGVIIKNVMELPT